MIKNIFQYFKAHFEYKHKRRLEYRKAKFEIKNTERKLTLDAKNKFANLHDTEFFTHNKHLTDVDSMYKPKLWSRLKIKFSSYIWIKARIRFPDGIDTIRHYKMVKPYVLEIMGDYYMFSPKSFRYENDSMFLEFHYNNPFAVIYTPTMEKTETFKPSFDAASFKNIMQSKIIEDMMFQEDMKIEFTTWLIIGGIALLIVAVGWCIFDLETIKKVIVPKK